MKLLYVSFSYLEFRLWFSVWITQTTLTAERAKHAERSKVHDSPIPWVGVGEAVDYEVVQLGSTSQGGSESLCVCEYASVCVYLSVCCFKGEGLARR